MRAILVCLTLAIALPFVSARPSVAGETILTLEGEFASGHQTHEFDLDALSALPGNNFTTTTIWTDGPQDFRGIPLRDLLEQFGIDSGTLVVTAINDYAVSIPVSEILNSEALLAYERNGKPMSVRDKGPLWVVYPYDSSEELRTEVIYTRSVWQVAKLTVDE
ncbi:hypothetical protein BFP70_18060 [Thioclava sp. SK-1]|uniref:molybdopterin-dependent oxidoreductase n=1 Tax=Thioclava sp. SK-1 TaxID=1889770 RepID=UPI000825F19E|nr:molybdopterin-dependent oxidoreductase [Thioclava sp. SK-1]OCX60003.1 hypothetical protein BFP70_18060 [Thioclava sp. SK-1]